MKTIKGSMTRKVGGLAAWKWLAVIGVGVYAYRRYTGSTSSATTASPDPTATSPQVVYYPVTNEVTKTVTKKVKVKAKKKPKKTPKPHSILKRTRSAHKAATPHAAARPQALAPGAHRAAQAVRTRSAHKQAKPASHRATPPVEVARIEASKAASTSGHHRGQPERTLPHHVTPPRPSPTPGHRHPLPHQPA